MKQGKRLVALAMAAVLMTGLCFTGCKASPQKGDGNDATAPQEEIVLKVLGGLGSGMAQGVQNNPVMDEIAKKTGVRLEIYGASSGSLEEMLTLQLASDSLMDVITDVDTGAIERAKKLVDMESYLGKYGSNIKAKYESLFPVWKINKLQDQKLYKLYNYTITDRSKVPATESGLGLGIRYDLLKEMGLPAINTTDDWYNVMKQMKEKYPTVDGNAAYPFATFLGEDWSVYWSLLTPFTCGQGIYERQSTYYKDDGTNVVIGSKADEAVFYQAMKFYNKMYQEGLFDPQSFEMTFDQLADKLKSGRVYSYATFSDMTNGAETFWQNDEATKNRTFAFPNIKTTGYEGKTVWDLSSSESTGSKIIGITTANKYPEKTMELFNFLASDEGQLLCGRGIEGVHYDIDASGRYVMKEDVMKQLQTDENYTGTSGVGAYKFLLQKDAVNEVGQSKWWFLDPDDLISKYSDAQKEAYAWQGQTLKGDTLVKNAKNLAPWAWSNQLEVPDSEGQISNQIFALNVNTTPKAILAKSDAEFDKVMKAHYDEMDNIGADTARIFMQEQYEKNKSLMESLEK